MILKKNWTDAVKLLQSKYDLSTADYIRSHEIRKMQQIYIKYDIVSLKSFWKRNILEWWGGVARIIAATALAGLFNLGILEKADEIIYCRTIKDSSVLWFILLFKNR